MLISSYKKELSNLAPPPNFGQECMILSLSHHEKCRFSRSEYPSSSYLRIPFMHRNLRRRWRREERNYCHCHSPLPLFARGRIPEPILHASRFERGVFPYSNCEFLPSTRCKHPKTPWDLNLLPCIFKKNFFSHIPFQSSFFPLLVTLRNWNLFSLFQGSSLGSPLRWAALLTTMANCSFRNRDPWVGMERRNKKGTSGGGGKKSISFRCRGGRVSGCSDYLDTAQPPPPPFLAMMVASSSSSLESFLLLHYLSTGGGGGGGGGKKASCYHLPREVKVWGKKFWRHEKNLPVLYLKIILLGCIAKL